MANRRYFGSIRRRETGRWQIRYRTRDGVRVSWPETYARRADAVRVLAELERQSQVAGNWLDVAGFAAYADKWINQHSRLRPRTADVYGVPAAQDLRIAPLGGDHRAHPE